MRQTGGAAEDCTDEEIVEGIRLLAESEGIFAETAGGVTVACAKKLIETGKIPADETAVLCITGQRAEDAGGDPRQVRRAAADQAEPAGIRGTDRGGSGGLSFVLTAD